MSVGMPVKSMAAYLGYIFLSESTPFHNKYVFTWGLLIFCRHCCIGLKPSILILFLSRHDWNACQKRGQIEFCGFVESGFW